MTLEQIQQAISERAARLSDLNASVKFVLDGNKIIHVDAKQKPPSISMEDKPADCTIRMSSETFSDIVSGRSSPATAFMFGKIRIEGNMSIALAVSRVL
ncbi:MAG: SCP2 sterol-binding domain-containing protein [Bacteroidia bacterium]|nr:SCP2 sterol-binding domain-containing protein [Bacteroidia bacterium]MCX7763746.1 SCP2 sterol-binding domain-containing protein [Bacteroidia bacterium]MDW8057344.1 SCP2 sterol-binding domain-containing protein [Bacteroidia bacterium]